MRYLKTYTYPLLSVLCAGILAVMWGCFYEPSRLIENKYQLTLPHWPVQCDGVRIDVVGDLHTGSPRNGTPKLKHIVQKLQQSDAQIVLLAGDYVILKVLLGKYVPPELIARELKPLAATKPVYAVLGNHDWWKNGEHVRKALESAGITVLDNQSALVTPTPTCRMAIAGLADRTEGKPDIIKTFAGIPENIPVIALTHQPDSLIDIPAHVALTVAGHTHGGQIDPWPFEPQRPATFKLGSHYLKGWYVDHAQRNLFVTSGVGTSIFPARIGVTPEIAQLTLHSPKSIQK